jgi:hypothetical protein
MLVDVRRGEWTTNRHRQTSCSDVVQGARDESTSHSVSFELVRDLRVDQYEAAWSLRVIEHAGQRPCDASLEPALIGSSTTSTDSGGAPSG